MGPVLGPHARTDRIRDTRFTEPRLPAPEDRRPGEGQRLTPDAPHNGGRPPPPGTAPHHLRGARPQQGMQAKGTVLGPHTHTLAPTARGWQAPTARPVGGQSGEGERQTSDAPHNAGRHPPPVTPFRHPHSEQRRPARAQAVEPLLGPQTDLATVAGQPPRGRPPTTPSARSSHRACRPRRQCRAPTPACPRPQHVGGRPRRPAQRAGDRERNSA